MSIIAEAVIDEIKSLDQILSEQQLPPRKLLPIMSARHNLFLRHQEQRAWFVTPRKWKYYDPTEVAPLVE